MFKSSAGDMKGTARARQAVGWVGSRKGNDLTRVSDAMVEGVYQALLGRSASEVERYQARLLTAEGTDISQLVSKLEASDEGIDYALTKGMAATRTKLRRDFDSSTENPADERARLVFLHIMKVGGTSLSDLITGWVGTDRSRLHLFLDDLILQPAPLLRRLRFISGHIPYEALRTIPGPFSTLCVMRDPFERTLSHYADLRANEPSFADLSLDEFVSDERFDVPSGNYQARQLAHEIGLSQAWITFAPETDYRARGGDPDQRYPLQALFDSTSITLSDSELYETAARHLAEITHVGVTSDLDGVAQVLAGEFGVPAQPVPRLNNGSDRERGVVTDSIRRRIDAKTAVDRELYETALRRNRPATAHFA